MRAKKVGSLAIKTDQQRSKLVDPRKAALTGKTSLVNSRIKQTFAPALGVFAVAFVRAAIGNDAMIEADFARLKRIQDAVGIEEGVSKD